MRGRRPAQTPLGFVIRILFGGTVVAFVQNKGILRGQTGGRVEIHKKIFNVNVNPDSNVKEFGQKLQELTNVRPDTMRLFVPQKNQKGSKMLSPFSNVHSMLSLRESAILEVKTIKMMGVFSNEVDEVSHISNKPDLRIAGFAEEEQRLRQRATYGPQASLKLPQGTYIFCEFRTLLIPGIELNPPPSEALRRMHMLACDPGIIAIMNKHRWRVGVMSEMAPEGYVGISPKCILGFNKNHGEEICLRLRTDDLQGFRKYESIKRTLLHELAHMVYSEHDSNFFALNKQLNEEAASLDWTKSTSHTLSGRKYLDHYEEEDYVELSSKNSGQKLGGATNSLVSARASSIAAAYIRMANASSNEHMPAKSKEPDPVDSQMMDNQGKFSEPDLDDMVTSENDVMLVDMVMDARRPFSTSSMLDMLDELDPDDSLDNKNMSEPDPDDSLDNKNISEPDPDDSLNNKDISEPDPDDCLDSKNKSEPDPDDSSDIKNMSEPDPDDSHARGLIVSRREPDPDDTLGSEDIKLAKETDSAGARSNKVDRSSPRDSEPDPDDSLNNVLLDAQMEETHLGKHYGEPDLDHSVKDMVSGDHERLQQSAEGPPANEKSMAVDHVNDVDNQELQRIEEPAALFCSRLQRAIDVLQSEATPLQATSVLQTLFKIIRNVIEHPDEVKFRRLRKGNPQFQRNVANYKAAMEVLTLVGFCEDVVSDEIGRAETFLVLKRNDPVGHVRTLVVPFWVGIGGGGSFCATTSLQSAVATSLPPIRAAISRMNQEMVRRELENCLPPSRDLLFVHSDEIPPALRPYHDFQSDFNLALNDFTGAVFEGHLYGPDDFQALETMPTRMESYAYLLGCLQTPAVSLLSILQAPEGDADQAAEGAAATSEK
ncbi:hypothetical protein OPV22_011549 [Ensete ventricosum]|uniref:WLM domain-containing protein n=1 Tax=Ensete ventricosum TaxID=4639 RepID=A0AAV8RJA6_ENSVE|nr:hypothetical protein OPV22_011549 [Ensete ventricosum]